MRYDLVLSSVLLEILKNLVVFGRLGKFLRLDRSITIVKSDISNNLIIGLVLVSLVN